MSLNGDLYLVSGIKLPIKKQKSMINTNMSMIEELSIKGCLMTFKLKGRGFVGCGLPKRLEPHR